MGVWSIRRALAIFSLILYCFDQGSDFFVGSDLISKCHTRYGSSVICLVLLPGLVYGWILYFGTPSEERGKNDLLRAIIFPILFLEILHQFGSGRKKKDLIERKSGKKILYWLFTAKVILYNLRYKIWDDLEFMTFL